MVDRSGPLAGIRVIDLGHVFAGPYCAMMLGDMGAEVIKVEPLDGDLQRRIGHLFVQGENGTFLAVGRNKKSIAIDLKTDEGRRIMHQLVERSDVIIENFRLGVPERLQVDYDTLRRINPQIIYASLSGYGATGPRAHLPGLESTIQAVGGIMSITGEPGGEPVKVGSPLPDWASGVLTAYGTVLALFHRLRTGAGQRVDVSLLDSQVAALAPREMHWLLKGEMLGPSGTSHPDDAPSGAFKTSDGYIVFNAHQDRFWRALCRVLGLPELLEDERFVDSPQRVRHRRELNEILREAFAPRTVAECEASLQEAGIPVGRIQNIAEVFSDPQVLHNEMLVSVDHPTIGQVKMTGIPVKLSATPGDIALPPPLLGQHTAQVLTWLGYADSEIAELTQRGIVKQWTSV